MEGNAAKIARALSQLPPETNIEDVDLWEGTVRVKYSGVSSQAVESAGWRHVDSTDYYGVAERDYERDSGGFGIGLHGGGL